MSQAISLKKRDQCAFCGLKKSTYSELVKAVANALNHHNKFEFNDEEQFECAWCGRELALDESGTGPLPCQHSDCMGNELQNAYVGCLMAEENAHKT